jgi:hypothetical protein
MSQPMNYAQVAQKTEEFVREEKDLLVLRFKDGRVEYTLNKSEELLELERKREKKLANSLQVRMKKAVEEIETRRRQNRKKDMDDYGYDHYTKEFYYTCPETSESEISDEE